jgi:hypothetical protein
MQYPGPLRRQGVVPGLVRLVAVVLEALSFFLLLFHHDPEYSWTTSYVIVSEPTRCLSETQASCLGTHSDRTPPHIQLVYLILIDLIEILSLCGQARGWFISALPMLIAGDAIGALVLVCSRDWYGLWYWHGPWYTMQHQIGSGLFFSLP